MSNTAYKDAQGATFTVKPKILLEAPWDVEEYIVPEGTEMIGEDAFPSSLRRVTLPSTLKSIWSNAFNCCLNLEKIVIPDSVEQIGFNAFCFCGRLKEVVLPKALKEIEPETFSQCSSLERIVIPQNVKKIYDSAFEDCTSMKEIVVPQHLEAAIRKQIRSMHSHFKVKIVVADEI